MHLPMGSLGSSVISVPSAWRRARFSRSSNPTLIDELERAAAAEGTGIEPRWPCIGRYRVCGKLGQGGMSTVWEALDDRLGRRVAIKLLRADLSAEYGLRLRREAQALAKLSHPNVVQVYEAMEIDGLTAVVMELVEGQTLRRWQELEPRPSWRSCVEVYLEAGRGLAAVHATGLVHRDFKPDNCIVDPEGRVRVLDFGLVAREHDEPTAEMIELISTSDSLELQLTRPGTLMGTAAYMPPERLERRGDGDGLAGDQFSFCASLYEALYGDRPFEGDTEEELCDAIVARRVRPAPEGNRVPSRVRRVVLRALEPEPAKRWSCMNELLEALEWLVQPPRHWRWLGVGIGTVLMGAVMFGAVHGSMPRPACSGTRDRITEVWNGEQREAVRAAILATRTQHAIDTWARTERMLDEYASRWTSKHTEVCEATRVTGVQTEEDMGLRMRCLDGRRHALRETVGVLMRPDASTRQQAVELVAELPSLSGCDDLQALHAELPPPGNDELARAVEGLRAQLSRLRAQREAGQYASLEEELEGLVEQAQQLGYEPLLAEARLERGELRVVLAQREEAEQDFERAYDLAQRSEHREVETRAAASLARLLADERVRLAEAERWGQSAMNLAKRRGMERLRLAEATSAMGYAQMMQWRLDNDAITWRDTLALHRRALELYESAVGPRHPATAAALEALGDLRMKQKMPGHALDNYELALPLCETSLGSSHPAVANLLVKLGTALVKQDEPDLALELYERALRIQHDVLGPQHPAVAQIWTHIGITRHMQGRFEDALALHQHALSLLKRRPSPDPYAVIGILSEIGFVLRDMDRMEEALQYYDRTLAIREEVDGPSHPFILQVLISIGDELLDRGMLDEAKQRYQRVIDSCDDNTDHNSRCGIARLRLAEVSLARQDFADAARYAELAKSHPALMRTETTPYVHMARARFLLARRSAEPKSDGEAYLAEAERQMQMAVTLGWHQGDPRRPSEVLGPPPSIRVQAHR